MGWVLSSFFNLAKPLSQGQFTSAILALFVDQIGQQHPTWVVSTVFSRMCTIPAQVVVLSKLLVTRVLPGYSTHYFSTWLEA